MVVGGCLQSAEAEIGQMVTVRFKWFACPLYLLCKQAFSPYFPAVFLLIYQRNSVLDVQFISFNLFIVYLINVHCCVYTECKKAEF